MSAKANKERLFNLAPTHEADPVFSQMFASLEDMARHANIICAGGKLSPSEQSSMRAIIRDFTANVSLAACRNKVLKAELSDEQNRGALAREEVADMRRKIMAAVQ